MTKKRCQRSKTKSLYLWHRYAGLFAALFTIFVTITGIALNHTDDLAFKKQHISSSILLAPYNVQPPTTVLQFKTPKRLITQADDLLFIDKNSVLATQSPMVGTMELEQFLVVALSDRLLLIDADNQLADTLTDIDGVPSNIINLGKDHHGHLNLLTKQKTYHLDDDLTLKELYYDAPISWSVAEQINPLLRAEIDQQYKSNIISLETFILDVHSGRYFGSYGILFFDAIGIILLFLAFTGVIIWLKQRVRHKKTRD